MGEALQVGESSLQGPPHRERGGREVLSSEGKPGSPAPQSFKKALCGWSQVLKDSVSHSPLLRSDGNTVGLVTYSYLLKQFHLKFYHTSNLCPKLTFLGFSLISLFLYFQVLRKLREVAEFKRYAAHLEQEGLWELEMTLVGTPVSLLVDLIAARVHGVYKSVPSSSRAPSSSVER